MQIFDVSMWNHRNVATSRVIKADIRFHTVNVPRKRALISPFSTAYHRPTCFTGNSTVAICVISKLPVCCYHSRATHKLLSKQESKNYFFFWSQNKQENVIRRMEMTSALGRKAAARIVLRCFYIWSYQSDIDQTDFVWGTCKLRVWKFQEHRKVERGKQMVTKTSIIATHLIKLFDKRVFAFTVD